IELDSQPRAVCPHVRPSPRCLSGNDASHSAANDVPRDGPAISAASGTWFAPFSVPLAIGATGRNCRAGAKFQVKLGPLPRGDFTMRIQEVMTRGVQCVRPA